MPFYAVAKGFKPGVYESWYVKNALTCDSVTCYLIVYIIYIHLYRDECLKQVVNFEGVKFKMFHSKYEAMQYVENNGGSKPAQDNNMVCHYHFNNTVHT